MYTLLDFYAGVGGISLGFQLTKTVKTIFAVDYDNYCKITYDKNHKQKLLIQDISTLKKEDIPKADIISLGFNCQPFSIAGEQKGFDDKRTDSLSNIFNIIKYIKPKCVFMENVKNLLTHDNGNSLKKIIKSLQNCNMKTIIYHIYNTSEYTGIPQNRERLFIISFSKKISNKFINDMFNFPKIPIKSWKLFLEKEIPEKYYYSNQSKIYLTLNNNIKNSNSIYQYRRGIVRENKNNVCPTLVAVMGTGGHNVPIINDKNKIRKLTPKECFNLQGFPDNFILPDISDSHLYKQCGNSVTVPLIYILAKSIVHILNNY